MLMKLKIMNLTLTEDPNIEIINTDISLNECDTILIDPESSSTQL